jgi:hypothetical protein
MKQDFGKEMRFSTIEDYALLLNNSTKINRNKREELESYIDRIINKPSNNAIDIIYMIGEFVANKEEYNTIKNGEISNFSNPDFEEHIQFLSNTLICCFSLGQQQGLFRQDIHKEMIGRSFARKYIDMFDCQIFPQDFHSFKTSWVTEFKHFIKGICNTKGLEYFRSFNSNKLTH